jgi:hypothetical protein
MMEQQSGVQAPLFYTWTRGARIERSFSASLSEVAPNRQALLAKFEVVQLPVYYSNGQRSQR